MKRELQNNFENWYSNKKNNNVSSCQLQIQINGKTPNQLTLIDYRISKRSLEEKGLSL